jgi:hypothetical protein
MESARQTRRLLELARFKGLKEYRILNRVATKGGEVPKAEYNMKMTHFTLDAV